MNLAMKVLCRVVQRRVNSGEKLVDILQDYPKLTKEEKQQVREYLARA